VNGRAAKRIRIAARDVDAQQGGEYRRVVKDIKRWFKSLNVTTKNASPSHRSVLRAYHGARNV
jgi:hypothetical protein